MEGESLELAAIISPDGAEYGQINWSSSDASIATVSSDGTVSGVCAGTVTITVEVDGMSGYAEITVEHAGVQLWEYGPYWAESSSAEPESTATNPSSFRLQVMDMVLC